MSAKLTFGSLLPVCQAYYKANHSSLRHAKPFFVTSGGADGPSSISGMFGNFGHRSGGVGGGGGRLLFATLPACCPSAAGMTASFGNTTWSGLCSTNASLPTSCSSQHSS
eukprot:gnl/MRDRNA2_/MRDRNA2_48770_c0_seq2.p1 gnl/MRDRNA2_/MRDRNA2_48770_c0~~gnl/MRDRNA2_/MRDRNA2_48770_c0_seq2.p1  ORF type:complete len:110 (-),score=5.09 gnl/MRDRNA2_/MRDRNA2_48770_c0_seq2:104-433(-)